MVAAFGNIRVDVFQREVSRLIGSPTGPVVREVEQRTRDVANRARQYAEVDTGTTRASIRTQIDRPSRGEVVGRVLAGSAALLAHTGTGIYGPRGRVITPRRGRVLVFPTPRMIGPLPEGARAPAPGQRALLFRPYVRGRPRNPWLVQALRDAQPYPVTEGRIR